MTSSLPYPRRWASWIVMVATALALLGCGDASSSGTAALTEALSRSAGRAGIGHDLTPDPGPWPGALAHRLTIALSLTLEPTAGAATVLTIHQTVDRDEQGRYRLQHRRSLAAPQLAEPIDNAHSAVFDGDGLAVRRAAGPWMRREVLDGQHRRLLAQAYGLGADVLDVFGDYLVFKDDPSAAGKLAGLDARWSAVALNPRVAPRRMPAEELAALRDHEANWIAWAAATHRPTEVRGAIARATETGELLAGDLELEGRAEVEGTVAPFRLSVSYSLAGLPKDADFTVPADALSARRQRPWRMIKDVLGEQLAPIYR